MSVNHKAISDLNDLKDRIDLWINHNRQPEAYRAPAEGLGELSARLSKIASEVENG